MNINSVEDEHTSSALDVIESPRKRMRLDNSGRKSWSLMDRRTDTDVLQEMGVSLLEPDDGDNNCDSNVNMHRTIKRKHDIENVNPNISRVISPTAKVSPGPSRKSPRSCDKLPLQPTEHTLDTTLTGAYLIEEETPLGQSISTGYKHVAGYSATTTTSGKKLKDVECIPEESSPVPSSESSEQRVSLCAGASDTRDTFSLLPDELVLAVLRWLPKRALAHCALVCKRYHHTIPPYYTRDTFSLLPDELVLAVLRWLPKRALAHCALVCKRLYRLACDETLWQRLDLGNKTLAKDALGRILARKPVIVRLASSEANSSLPYQLNLLCCSTVGWWITFVTMSNDLRTRQVDP
ncbi:unnamed protein product [Euphydryas editha]|uniref:F-box domain-containing protein n=1 Tax=Euphydryas editha TaxID=104508 RepID=A0AAU9TDE3_EUPED|nr:unnamed protein product [Euphydryas editha]